jgi:hypothetical protein
MTTKTKAELIEASEHVHHEFSIAVALSRHLARAAPLNHAANNQHVTAISNALVGSTAMAVRSLLGFAYGMGASKGTDIFATHYVPKWESVRPELDPELDGLFDRASKGVAHLSYARSVPENKLNLNGIKVFNALVPLHNAFTDNVDKDLLLRPLWDHSLQNRLELMPQDRVRIAFTDFEGSYTSDFRVVARAPVG